MIAKRKTFFFHPTLNNTNCRMDYDNDNDDSIYMNHFTINIIIPPKKHSCN